jgi:hypothetical protein
VSFLITKDVEALVKLRDAFKMASDAIDEYVDTFSPKETAGFTWNPEKIKWVQTEGSSGPYERSEDVNNPEFKAMLKDLAEHQGKFQCEGYFYWAFQKASVVGRKKRGK